MDIIIKCYEDEYIHPGYIGFDSFKEALAAGKEECLENIKKEMKLGYLDDIHAVMSWWACFEENKKKRFDEEDDDLDYNFNTENPFHNTPRKKKNRNKSKMSKASKKKNRKKK